MMLDASSWKQVRNERRMKLVPISIREIESYCLIRFGKLSMESMSSMYDLPHEWISGGLYHSFELDAIIFRIFSPEFDSVELGAQPPMICPNKQWVKITREVL